MRCKKHSNQELRGKARSRARSRFDCPTASALAGRRLQGIAPRAYEQGTDIGESGSASNPSAACAPHSKENGVGVATRRRRASQFTSARRLASSRAFQAKTAKSFGQTRRLILRSRDRTSSLRLVASVMIWRPPLIEWQSLEAPRTSSRTSFMTVEHCIICQMLGPRLRLGSLTVSFAISSQTAARIWKLGRFWWRRRASELIRRSSATRRGGRWRQWRWILMAASWNSAASDSVWRCFACRGGFGTGLSFTSFTSFDAF
mmetsp:Transcript_39249/g.73209  ORF Transcript_39249/g.73209 Transcript_39249/m.73209 type:complete len:260 (+) Transcript_39249:345-1124(+)